MQYEIYKVINYIQEKLTVNKNIKENEKSKIIKNDEK